MPQPKALRWWVCLFAFALVSPQPRAAGPDSKCPTVEPLTPAFESIAEGDTDTASALTRLRADRLEALGDEWFRLSGNAEVQRQDQRVLADEILYDQRHTRLQAYGAVRLESIEGDQLRTEALELELEGHSGYLDRASYRLGRNHARGDAARIELEDEEHMRLYKLRYTTCPPGRDDWFFSLGRLELDKARNIGTARHAVLRFKRVPLFYWPYLRFPISDERQSGFLFPEVGSSTKLGTSFAWPFYWNIAPNYDATITPRWLSKRGLQTQSEFRYLGQALHGELGLEFLQNDDETGEDRWGGKYNHTQTLGRGWSASVNYQKVSDDAYLDEFRNSVRVTSLAHLPQEAAAGYSGSVWRFGARAFRYQTIDPSIALADRPYELLPQLTLSAHPYARPGHLSPLLESELVNFQRDQSLTGRRLNLLLGMSLPWRRPYAYVTPKLSVKHIGYRLDDIAPADERPDLSVPIFSLDSGLIFERRSARFVHTLEPRLFYLHVPFEEQDDLPNFDTSLPELSFANLFRENRFVGGDRVADANQATLALTTRLFDAADGIERLSASVGQILHLKDRKVNLVPATVDTRERSDLVAELTARFAERWYGSATVQWNDDTRTTERSSYFFQYEPAIDRIVNLRYSFDRDSFKQIDVSTQWPLGSRWTVAASSSYSLRDERNVESYAGFQYRSCCWALRLFARRRLDLAQEQSNDVLLQFEFTGLGRIGDAPESPLMQSIFIPRRRGSGWD